ncbi:hypothetical protein E2C01_090500 [Portunus trituberculatus]|uniref:Uncharacterized protein n=1 Tax=Portunus trituberculatus TaxID=210409 RepID=A0A5B7JQA0_PORTR|nr:hypothetical protein [Portunus trituberculatus]
MGVVTFQHKPHPSPPFFTPSPFTPSPGNPLSHPAAHPTHFCNHLLR